ncbi:MAG TPA: alpha/beta fold hydrolase [Methanoregulaceae archaeon]|nr:alpha/beta fold hydrolase [Methanoregulaceae archaeon]HQJ87703.1 alpha/beta fold hydrolase [Methanoregulaceae archaeon]
MSSFRRFVRIAGAALAATALLLYVVLPIGFAAYASLPHPARVGPPPEGFTEVELMTDDGVPLAAWFAPSKNGAAIVLIHGATDSREGVRGHAGMLRDAGFGVLAPDLRGHGKSGGRGNAFGWEGTRDVRAAVAYLETQDGVRTIGGLGLSLGGEVLLGALNTTPSLVAVAADGATHRCTADLLAVPGRDGILRSGVTRLMYAATGVFTGEEPPVPIVESIAGAPNARLLLVAAGEVPDETAYGTAFVEAAGPMRAELWTVPGASHTGAFRLDPEGYRTRVTGFFQSALLTGKV